MKENIEDKIEEQSINKNSNSNSIQKENLYSNSLYSISYSILDNPIMNKLLELGYDYKLSKKLISYLNPRSIEQAIDYLLIENGIIQHHFIEDLNNENKCKICEKKREEHLIFISIDSNEIERNSIHLTNNSYRINNEEKISINFSSIKNNNSINKSNNNEIKSLKGLSFPFNETEKKICPICEEECVKNDEIQLENCFHSFCKICWLTYIKNELIEKKQIKIKCMDHLCNEILPEMVIYTIIKDDKNLISKYNENKLRQEILNNPKKKFCPYPNCNSYAILNEKNNKNVKCENGHLFCFYCLQKPHDNIECNKELDEKMEEFAKKKFIKKCPNCGCWTEKIDGCNHITCIECTYQWCWLCNNKYTSEHYSSGKCKGFQFFKPKNEEEIQLAFEGKIQLRDDEIQDFFFLDDDFPRRIVINNNFQRRVLFNVENFGFWKKFFLVNFFLLFGTIIVIICESGDYLPIFQIEDNLYLIHTFYFFFVITFGLSIFFIQIFINFLILLLMIIFKSLDDFYQDFYSLITKLKNCSVLTDYGSSLLNIYFNFITFFISLFFGSSFWIIKATYYEYDTIYLKAFHFFYYLSIFILNFSKYPFTILLNIIGIIFLTVRDGDFYSLKKYIKDVCNLNR